MKFTNAAIIIFTFLAITSDRFADAAKQLRGHRGLVGNEDNAFVNTDTNTGEMEIISFNPTPPPTVDPADDVFTPAAPLETFKSVSTNKENQYKQKRSIGLMTSRCTLKSNSTCSRFLHTIHSLTSTSKPEQTNWIVD